MKRYRNQGSFFYLQFYHKIINGKEKNPGLVFVFVFCFPKDWEVEKISKAE